MFLLISIIIKMLKMITENYQRMQLYILMIGGVYL